MSLLRDLCYELAGVDLRDFENIKMKAFTLALLAYAVWTSSCYAGEFAVSPTGGSFIQVDWQDPALVPPRFRNHCSVDTFRGRPYCANHCGGSYEFYFCSQASFGCCHLGRGYCDWSGALRCSP